MPGKANMMTESLTPNGKDGKKGEGGWKGVNRSKVRTRREKKTFL